MEHLGAWAQQPRQTAAAGVASYSIKHEFNGATVFITGASGYIGSVLLEQLLRTTDVATVYLLLRPRRGMSSQERADKLLQGSLFHKVSNTHSYMRPGETCHKIESAHRVF